MEPSGSQAPQNEEEVVKQQEQQFAAKYGGLKPKMPLLKERKKRFDSADYYREKGHGASSSAQSKKVNSPSLHAAEHAARSNSSDSNEQEQIETPNTSTSN
eukprot:GILK01004857.1.p1 GENE.GILK01004857.1~~GILK01004857.1.p1  ORF type:complete len:115 (+),score=26.34 GILK01004857.1:43-345(+)